MPASAKPNLLVDATRLSAWITGVSSRATLEVDHPVSVPRHRRVMNVGRLSHPVGRTRAANAQHAVRTGEISRVPGWRVSPAREVSEGGFEPPRPARGTRPSTYPSTCRPDAPSYLHRR